MQTHNHDPFMTGTWGGHPIGAVVASERLNMIRNFDLAEIDQALQVEGLQKTVVAALNRRRRQLIKEQHQS